MSVARLSEAFRLGQQMGHFQILITGTNTRCRLVETVLVSSRKEFLLIEVICLKTGISSN